MKITIEDKGWKVINETQSLDDIISVARDIGTIHPQPDGSLYKVLSPSKGKSSIKGIFSERYKLGSFPLHTDYAFNAKPIRYILLATLQPSLTGTTFLDSWLITQNLPSQIKSTMNQAIYKIKTNQGQYYLPLMFKGGLRFDPTCMIPANESAKVFLEFFTNEITKHTITRVDWTKSSLVVFDNWRVLHGRESIKEADRQLIRININ